MHSGWAKRFFTGWALLVFLFLYLPIGVVVLFALNKPSPSAVESFQGDNICDIDPADIGRSVVNTFAATMTCAMPFDGTPRKT